MMLFADEVAGMGANTIGLLAVISAVSTASGVLISKLIDYRKTADAGEIKKIELRVAEIERESAQAKFVAAAATAEAAATKKEVEKCHENHRVSEMEQAEQRGRLKAIADDRAILSAKLIEAIRETSELRGQMNVVRVQVARDTSDTMELAKQHGVLTQNVGGVVERLAILETNGGGTKP